MKNEEKHCKWYNDEFCTNADSPCVADYCPVVEYPELCKCREVDKDINVRSKNDTEIDVGMSEEALVDTLKEGAIKFSKDSYIYRVLVDTINLINHKNAEIERLTEEKKELEKTVNDMSWIIKIHKYCVGANHCQNRSDGEFELQKQVDELKERANGHLLTSLYKKQADDHKRAISVQRTRWEKKVKQAVKDTAKEICKAIHEDLQADLFSLKHSIFDTERQKAQEQQNIGILSAQDTVSRFEKKIKKRYGVEVE